MLEIGCGTGNTLRALRDGAPNAFVAGMDLFVEGLGIAQKRAPVALVCADVRRPPFREKFSLIGMFDVLEHLQEDLAALRDVRSLVRDDGAFLVTVPARQALWSYFDESSHHCRRYEEAELCEKLAAAGFRVEFVSFFMRASLPLLYAARKMARLRRGDQRSLTSQELQIVPGLNPLLTRVLIREARSVAAGHKLSNGSSLVAVARPVRS